MVNRTLVLLFIAAAFGSCRGFAPHFASRRPSAFRMAAEDDNEEKAAPMVTGEELEKMLTEWDTPLVVDAYATW